MLERKFCYLIVQISAVWISWLNIEMKNRHGVTNFITSKEIEIWSETIRIWNLFHSNEEELKPLRGTKWVFFLNLVKLNSIVRRMEIISILRQKCCPRMEDRLVKLQLVLAYDCGAWNLFSGYFRIPE